MGIHIWKSGMVFRKRNLLDSFGFQIFIFSHTFCRGRRNYQSVYLMQTFNKLCLISWALKKGKFEVGG